MTVYGSRHDKVSQEASHRRALVLSEVATEGTPGLSRVLRRAASIDGDAADIQVAALVRALPGMGALDCHDLLSRAHIREAGRAGDLTPGQRVALVELADRTQKLRATQEA
ncbi:hypothetical protein [Streptomyces sp. HPF1205]|uniref:hypothetical protein n=1 Tax=Streptomyces sp. HPF1205 TaxID=2873262 RepID=UPI001CEC48BD|nr:hypothetical protein [Streptomyces sp. HPF1205]